MAACNGRRRRRRCRFVWWLVDAHPSRANGYHHSKAFTFQDFAEPIRIKPGNAAVLEQNCLRCHGETTGEITAHGTLGVPSDPTLQADLYGCVRCHQDVGHGPHR